jgi:hypothetical protein
MHQHRILALHAGVKLYDANNVRPCGLKSRISSFRRNVEPVFNDESGIWGRPELIVASLHSCAALGIT